MHSRNNEITTELEALAVQCEDVEDKVASESKGRNEEKARVNNELGRDDGMM